MGTCPSCGAAVADDLLGGQCPRCLAKTTLGLKVRYFGDYELLEEIGRGGMGVVFKARQVSLHRTVAVKMLLQGGLASEEFVKRFHAEAEAAASLQHQNIVAIHEIGVHEGQPYFSMDYVEGQSLEAVVGDRPLPARRAARYLQQIAEATHYAHEHRILHRDLKPSNVVIDSSGQPHITDFGLAKRLDQPQLTLSGQVLGAPSYMPPEQAAGKRGEVRVQSDVYALGAILYHLLTGRPPFLADTLAETLLQVQTRKPTPPRTLNPAAPRDLEAVCLKCLEKEPGDRYGSAAALAEDLRRWQAGQPILARPLRLPQRTWRAGRRHPVWACLGLLVLLGLAGAALCWPRPPPLRIPPQATELIVLTDNTEMPPRLCVTDPQGSFWHRLLIQCSTADVSPDGRHICYLRHDSASDASVWVSRLDGGGQYRLVAHAGTPYWLDEHTVLYQSPDLVGLWAVDIDSRRTRKLFDWSNIGTNYLVGGGILSPDRKHLLIIPQSLVFNPAKQKFVLWAPTMDIFVCDPDGRNVRAVWADVEGIAKPEKATTDHRPIWLGDSRVAWCRHARPGNRVADMAIVTCRLGETNFQALTPWKGYNYPLAGSPDGKRLLFTTEDTPGGGMLELWTMNVDGSDRRKLVNRKFGCDGGLVARWIRRPSSL